MADDDTPDPQRLIKLARQTQSSAERRKKYQKLDFLGLDFFYPTQLAFFAACSSGVHQRLIYGGSQTGKTTSCAAEVAWHVSGTYPRVSIPTICHHTPAGAAASTSALIIRSPRC